MQPERLTNTDISILRDACAQLRERAAPLAEWLTQVVEQERAREHTDSVRPQFDVTKLSKVGMEQSLGVLYGLLVNAQLSVTGRNLVNEIKNSLVNNVPRFMAGLSPEEK